MSLSFVFCPQAKSIKLAKQLAAVNFLREFIGTRKHAGLESLLAKASSTVDGNKRKAQQGQGRVGGGAMGSAAVGDNNNNNNKPLDGAC